MTRRASKTCLVLGIAASLLLSGGTALGGEARLLSNAELAEIYGGVDQSAQASDVDVFTAASCSTCTLNVTDSAQANLNAVILVNSVGSTVNAQVNVSTRMGSPGATTQADVGFSNGASVSGP